MLDISAKAMPNICVSLGQPIAPLRQLVASAAAGSGALPATMSIALTCHVRAAPPRTLGTTWNLDQMLLRC